jgi:predicted nucleic acid-binding protein
VEAFLLDTTILSVYLDPTHQFHAEKCRALDSLSLTAPRYISAVALAELTFGADLASAVGRGDELIEKLREKLRKAREHGVLDVTHHTASAYATIKSKMAVKYLSKPLRRDRPRYVEDWVDRATGKVLGVDENDLWMCAQSKGRGLLFVTTDQRMTRIQDADSGVRVLAI